MSYNGWSNYETWAVALWIGNEEGTYSSSVEMTRRSKDAGELARELKEWVGEMMPDLGASLASDLLSAALSEVDWYEIAEHYIADNADEETEETEA